MSVVGKSSTPFKASMDRFLLIDIGIATGGFNALLLRLGERFDMTIHRVLYKIIRQAQTDGRSTFSYGMCSVRLTKIIAILGAILRGVRAERGEDSE